METQTRTRRRQVLKGVVVSDKMSKTRVILVEREHPHPLYHKKSDRHSRVFIHDEKNESKAGDTVLAVADRPLSRLKHFRLQKVLQKGTLA